MQNNIKDSWTEKGHTIICPKYGPFVEIKRHCHNMARFFIYENPLDSNPIASWFQIASGITEVKYISDLFDNTVEWCGTAIEYENAKSNFHSRLLRELTRFNFIWGGFEAYCDSMNFNACPDKRKRGIVNSVNSMLKNKYENYFEPISFYNEIVAHLKKLITKNPWYGDINELFTGDNCTSNNLIGLKVVYSIRNDFAHGAFRISEPDGWNDVKPLDIGIINCSCRILLLSMQMLLLATYPNLKFSISQLHQSERKGVPAIDFLPYMHLKSFKHS